MKNSIKVERAKRDMTQGDLARSLGVNPGTINSIETRRFTPSVKLALRIANFFNMSMDDLFKLEEGDILIYDESKRKPS